MKYLLNSAIFTADNGLFLAKPLTKEDFINLIQRTEFTSAIGHQSTADLISALTGITIPVNRMNVQTVSGDELIIIKVASRLPEGRVLTQEELTNVPLSFMLVKHGNSLHDLI